METLRVALPPAVLVIAALSVRRGDGASMRPPWFLALFAALAALAHSGLVPDWLAAQGAALSQGCLPAAIAAPGMRTDLARILDVDARHVAMLAILALVLPGLALGYAAATAF